MGCFYHSVVDLEGLYAWGFVRGHGRRAGSAFPESVHMELLLPGEVAPETNIRHICECELILARV